MFEMHNVDKVFYRGQVLRRKQRVVQDVSFSLGPGEILGIIGPSGAGKSTIGKLAIRLLEPSKGRLFFEGRDITHVDRRTSRRLRASMQIVFQDPQASLHPGKKIGNLLREPLRLHRLTTRSEEPAMVKRMLAQVGLNTDILDRYPAEVSGGEKQRIVIARVMALRPRFVVLDEPTSMLDVSVQANILHLLMTLQQEWNMAYLYISHDMRLVTRLCQRLAVVVDGRIVEQGPVEEIMAHPRHACTKRLLANRINNP
ncbi:hypothetical protein DSCO28_26760 [Desulfosarcina ovata subsp. sediminis]|uniref:ABC transporter domain-containing protein n=1 Tax=Desulfosarcina ovata subsp. sediminis TaxID=885957 RepID=A0A5K7ZQN8_9BACT|nr:ATP-binding cassette domain-containing protein [Desulfosarcina ovata]BBO82110.1 hypothetical protein DSCO28_26760 [Desulfosarcina ovata subsp. sediminis]